MNRLGTFHGHFYSLQLEPYSLVVSLLIAPINMSSTSQLPVDVTLTSMLKGRYCIMTLSFFFLVVELLLWLPERRRTTFYVPIYNQGRTMRDEMIRLVRRRPLLGKSAGFDTFLFLFPMIYFNTYSQSCDVECFKV